jgi:hypothetical protein
MRLSTIVLAAGAGLAVSGAAAAQTLQEPMRRPGFWEQSMVMQGGRTMVMKYCADEALEKRFSAFSQGMAGRQTCSKREFHRTPAGIAFESICTSNGSTRDSQGTATGDFQSHFHVDVVTHSTPAGPRGAESHISMDGKWLGPCPAGTKPGDMTMPNGMVMNIDPTQR